MTDNERQSPNGPTDGPKERTSSKGGGITNRPLEEEQESQDAVPDRGHTKSDDSEPKRTPV